jgi:hypothetical protein
MVANTNFGLKSGKYLRERLYTCLSPCNLVTILTFYAFLILGVGF